ncbi:MAG TPA: hypothetical protein ENN78_01090 [Candidatus Omnitrophica bacterium]|nr:hypothetical protein [Candidatus Omnitrophota bacterium]
MKKAMVVLGIFLAVCLCAMNAFSQINPVNPTVVGTAFGSAATTIGTAGAVSAAVTEYLRKNFMVKGMEDQIDLRRAYKDFLSQPGKVARVIANVDQEKVADARETLFQKIVGDAMDGWDLTDLSRTIADILPRKLPGENDNDGWDNQLQKITRQIMTDLGLGFLLEEDAVAADREKVEIDIARKIGESINSLSIAEVAKRKLNAAAE